MSGVDSPIIRGHTYQQIIHGDLNQIQQTYLTSVNNTATKTYNDSSTLNISGKTKRQYKNRTVTCNGSCTQHAIGDKITTCIGGDIKIYLGGKTTSKQGLSFTTAATIAHITTSLGIEIRNTSFDLGLGIVRREKVYGPLTHGYGVDLALAYSCVSNVRLLLEETTLSVRKYQEEREFFQVGPLPDKLSVPSAVFLPLPPTPIPLWSNIDKPLIGHPDYDEIEENSIELINSQTIMDYEIPVDAEPQNYEEPTNHARPTSPIVQFLTASAWWVGIPA